MKKKLNLSIYWVCLVLLFLSVQSCKVKEPPLVFPLNPDVVFNDYKLDVLKSDKRYKDKDLVVKGKILEYYKNKAGEVVMILSSDNQTNGIICTLYNSEKQITKPLKKGDVYKLMGKCTGFKDNVILERCLIVWE